MLNLKKQSETLKVGDIELGTCPACASYVSHLYFMQDAVTKKQSKWYSCQCGVVWQTGKPTMIYDAKYAKTFQDNPKLSASYNYPVRVYSPIIEELLYGRKALLIGRPNTDQEKSLAERGWVPYTIDKNTSYNTEGRNIAGDFETHDFGESKFNMIWMYHTLECFHDPISALAKSRNLLTEDGILFIASPDTDFIHTRGSSGFRHWKPDTNYMMWNRRSLTKQLENLGFTVIMARQNCWQRFPDTDDFHIIAQVKFF